MKLSRSRIVLLALLCGTSILQADILIMKNGTKHEGNILSETPTTLRMRYRMTAKIWDEKDFSRDDIQQIIKQTPQEVELIELKKLIPTPDLLPADKYEQLIQDRLRPFINKYQGTPEASEAEGIVTTLQEEKKKVSNGEAKLSGRWLTASEVKGEQYNIEAYKIHQEMLSHMAQSDWLEALRSFDKLLKARPPYTASTYYPQAVADALTCISKQDTILSKMTQDNPALVKQREEGLKKLSDADQARTKAAIEEEKNKYRAQTDAQRRAGIRWLDFYKYDLNSIQSSQKALVGERTRLETINIEELKTRNEAFAAVYRKIGEGDYTGGAAAFERVQAFSQVAEYREVVADLRAKLMQLYTELVRKSQSGHSAVAGSAAMGSTTASNVDDRVARILAGNNPQATAAAPGTTAAAPGTPAQATPAANTAAPAGQATTPGTTPAAQPVQAGTAPGAPAANPPVQQAPVAQVPHAAPAPVVIPEESNTQTYIIIGMGVLLALFGFLAFKKKKE
jgi:LPXTG-motif cell wall-anchored protein